MCGHIISFYLISFSFFLFFLMLHSVTIPYAYIDICILEHKLKTVRRSNLFWQGPDINIIAIRVQRKARGVVHIISGGKSRGYEHAAI